MNQPQLNQLILTSADYKVLLIVDGKTFPILTGESVSFNASAEEETIYAIGLTDPIGNKKNAIKRSGKISMQNGEMAAILLLLGYTESISISDATLAIAAVKGSFSRVYGGLNINSEAVDIKAKDKQSIISMDWTALSVV